MTPMLLQKALKDELEQLFRDFHSSGDATVERKAVSIYEQDLPLNTENEDEDTRFPYIIIRLSEGEMEQRDAAELVTVILIFSSKDANWNQHGYKDVLNMIQTVKERFLKNPQLGAFFTAELPMKWVIQENETYDIYFGGMELNFACPAICRESRFA